MLGPFKEQGVGEGYWSRGTEGETCGEASKQQPKGNSAETYRLY